jgi:hypothetical protein
MVVARGRAMKVDSTPFVTIFGIFLCNGPAHLGPRYHVVLIIAGRSLFGWSIHYALDRDFGYMTTSK